MRQPNLNEKLRNWQQSARQWLLTNTGWRIGPADMEPVVLRVDPPVQRRRTRKNPLD